MVIYLLSQKGKVRGMYVTDPSSLNSHELLRSVTQKAFTA